MTANGAIVLRQRSITNWSRARRPEKEGERERERELGVIGALLCGRRSPVFGSATKKINVAASPWGADRTAGGGFCAGHPLFTEKRANNKEKKYRPTASATATTIYHLLKHQETALAMSCHL